MNRSLNWFHVATQEAGSVERIRVKERNSSNMRWTRVRRGSRLGSKEGSVGSGNGIICSALIPC